MLVVPCSQQLSDAGAVPAGSTKMDELQTTYAYTAGLIDGEGSILLTRRRRNERRSPAVSVTSTSYELVCFLRQSFGGAIINQKTYKKHHRQAWIWVITHRRVLAFLRIILPYMREQEKIRRAKLLLDRYLVLTPRNGRYTSALLKQRTAFEKAFLKRAA